MASARAGSPVRPRVVTLVATFHPRVGGVQRATEAVCRELVAAGDDVVLLTRRLPGLPRAERIAGIPVHRPGLASDSKAGALSFGLHALWLLATRLRRHRVLHVHNIDTPLLVGLVARLLLPGRILVCTVHGEAKIADLERTRAGRARLRLLLRLVDVHCALTEEMRRALLAAGAPADRIRVISNGIDPAAFRPPEPAERERARRRLDIPLSATVFLSLGRLVPGKRVDVALRAWSRLPGDPARCLLLVVGEGPERRRLEALAARLGLGNVRFEGGSADVLPYLHAADVFVSASEREGLSMALLEAMAVGLTVVVSGLPGNEALVRDGENGLLVPAADPEGLSARLAECLGSPSRLRTLGRAARESLDARRTVRHAAELHRQAYAEAASGPGPTAAARSTPRAATGVPTGAATGRGDGLD